MRKLTFSNHVMNVFNEMDTDYTSVKNLMFDLAMGNKIFDEDGIEVSKHDAEDKLRSVCQKIFGVTKDSSKRDLKRAYREHGRDFFDIIEETLDDVIVAGYRENEFFNQFVDYRNIALGDAYEFYTENEVILSVAKVGTSHHDYILQRLGKGETFTIPYARYGAAVGADINMYMIGREDWAKLVNAIARAFTVQIQGEIYNELLSASTKIPAAIRSGFVGTGALAAATKAAFDGIIENVQAANDSNVVILGTKTALKQLNNLSDVDWRANSLKEDVSHSGRMGDYEGVTLMEIPQRFVTPGSLNKMYDNTKLWILPASDTDKFIKMVDVGETEIDEITEKGEEHGRWDDIMKYEVQRSYGIATIFGKYFGQWTLSA